MKLLSSEAALYLYKPTKRSCMEYCCLVRAGVSGCYLKLLHKLQKRICRTGPSLAASLEPLAHRWNLTTFSLYYRYYFGRCSSEMDELVPHIFLKVGLLVNLIDCMMFLSPFLYVKKMSMPIVCLVAQFVRQLDWFWNYLPIGCFALNYNLNAFKTRINRHLLTAGVF